MTTATIVHQVPGRLRLRIPMRRRDAGYFTRFADAVEGIAGMTGCEVNPATASVVLHYQGSAERLLRQIRERIPALEVQQQAHAPPPARRASAPVPRLVSGRDISPMFMVGAALAGLGLVQTLRGRITVPSITAFWYALESFRRP